MKKIERKLHKIDATNESAGRLASRIAIILRGKNKPEYEPHLDMGDIVEVSNVDKLKFTGKKLDQKKYYHYSGYQGGMKETKMKNLFTSKPSEILKKAVKDMLPATKLRNNMLKRLLIK